MQAVEAYAIGLLAALVLCNRCTMLTRIHAELRWARRLGSPDELRYAKGLWWGALSATLMWVSAGVFALRQSPVEDDPVITLGFGLGLTATAAGMYFRSRRYFRFRPEPAKTAEVVYLQDRREMQPSPVPDEAEVP